MATTAEYGLGELTFPRGWFMIATSGELGAEPIPVRYFGQEMVLYRGKSGRLVLLSAYCAHMGVNIARNTTSYVVHDGTRIEGDSIRCPAHGWRYNPEGKCDDIPYSKNGSIPKAACIKAFTVVERAGCIWMWHDLEAGEPSFDLPDFAEWDLVGEGWVRWEIDNLGTLAIHPQEILDNFTDYAHFGPVHGSIDSVYFENRFEDHVMWQRFGAGHRTLVDGGNLLESESHYTGPGILLSRMKGKHPSIMMICNTPVDDGVVRVWYALTAKMAEGRSAEGDELEAAKIYHKDGLAAFLQDFELWQHKAPALRILQIPDDGPFHKGRIWHRQFYSSREKAKELQARVNGVAEMAV